MVKKKSAQTSKPKSKKVSLPKKLVKASSSIPKPLVITSDNEAIQSTITPDALIEQTELKNLPPQTESPSTIPSEEITSGFTLEEPIPKDSSTPISATIPTTPSVAPSSPVIASDSVAIQSSTTPVIPTLDKKADLAIDSITVEEELPPEEKQGILFYILGSIFGVLILAGVITLGVLYFKTSDQKPAAPASTPTPTPTAQITEAPKPTILKNSEITFEVLNASGITGEAAMYGKRLEALGYKVNTLGNFPGQTGSTISISKILDPQKDLLIADLKKEFPTATFFSETTDSTSLVRFIIGK